MFPLRKYTWLWLSLRAKFWIAKPRLGSYVAHSQSAGVSAARRKAVVALDV